MSEPIKKPRRYKLDDNRIFETDPVLDGLDRFDAIESAFTILVSALVGSDVLQASSLEQLLWDEVNSSNRIGNRQVAAHLCRIVQDTFRDVRRRRHTTPVSEIGPETHSEWKDRLRRERQWKSEHMPKDGLISDQERGA